jgi:hypothetical protein
MELLEAKEELKEVNSQLTLYMKKKKALQDFIEEENKRLKQYTDPKIRAYSLKKDEEFIKLYGRERTAKEIGRIMSYSERQVQRFLKED